ncbi:hypothetical protein ACCC98_27050 [Rhizobium pisi]|uniref:hypothetical protein n=1 Tax=Rhizobium pisi TaxID=574561 RepID=UPI0039AF621C
MRKFVFAAAMLMSGEAFAGCELISGPCWTQGRDTYTMERNSGGSYNTYRNGDPYSQTQQNLGGNYRETIYSGGSRTYNYDPYKGFDSKKKSNGW